MIERIALSDVIRLAAPGRGAGAGRPDVFGGRCIRCLAMLVLSLAAACGSARGTSDPAEYQVRLIVSNDLIAPVTVSVDGVAQLGLQGGKSSGLTVPVSAQWLTWTSAKPMDSQGRPIPDDIGEVRIAIAAINRDLKISNVIDNQPYITAGIFNHTGVAVSIGVFNGETVSCASALPAASDARSGFTQIGYYKLLPATTVRAYRDPLTCSGPYFTWPPSQLRGFSERSGVIVLSLDSAP